MDLLNTVFVYVQAIPVIVTVCSAIAATTETPKDDEFFAKVYKFVDLFALNFGKAKQVADSTK
jgi:hypothetical protein|tara:strand:+ start:1026 stop:1214 length:189 start_codon:yes stop_codon:yes gene_type:complete